MSETRRRWSEAEDAQLSAILGALGLTLGEDTLSETQSKTVAKMFGDARTWHSIQDRTYTVRKRNLELKEKPESKPEPQALTPEPKTTSVPVAPATIDLSPEAAQALLAIDSHLKDIADALLELTLAVESQTSATDATTTKDANADPLA